MDKIKAKLLKVYLKLLKFQVDRNWDKARDHHARYIQLSLKLKKYQTKNRKGNE